jgi:hypothetical protein
VSYPYATYTPSPVEIAIIAGAVAFLAFGYTLAERYLDLEEADVHAFFPWPWLRDGHAGQGDGEPATPADGAETPATEIAA